MMCNDEGKLLDIIPNKFIFPADCINSFFLVFNFILATGEIERATLWSELSPINVKVQEV